MTQSRNERAQKTEKNDGGERLHKVLANAGVASRRACEQLILEGRVSVDGEIVTRLGTKVDPERADLRVDGERIRPVRRVTYAVHKPRGVVSTTSDNDKAPKVTDLVRDAGELRLYPVGRLDKDSDGLMLLTNDGALAQRLMHPRYGVKKTYRVRVEGEVDERDLKALEAGVWTSDGKLRALKARVLERRKPGRSGSGKRGARVSSSGSTVIEVVLSGGRNRQLRRMLAKLGKKVRRLTRTAIGPIRLGTLKKGSARLLKPAELAALERTIAGGAKRGRSKHRPRAHRGS